MDMKVWTYMFIDSVTEGIQTSAKGKQGTASVPELALSATRLLTLTEAMDNRRYPVTNKANKYKLYL